MRWLVPLGLAVLLTVAVPAAAWPALESRPAIDETLSADIESPFWHDAPSVFAEGDVFGSALPALRTEIRSRWSATTLYLLYVCPYTELNLKLDPDRVRETMNLWNWDVAEAFLAGDMAHPERYREFEVSPQGEWVDLDIDPRKSQWGDPGWNSGFHVAARIDEAHHLWYGAMAIPWSALIDGAPKAGLELRANFYRLQGPPPYRALIAWQPTGKASFHVPETFGVLRLVGK